MSAAAAHSSARARSGTLGLAVVDLIVLQQEAARAQLYPLSDDVDELVQRPLALYVEHYA